MRNDVGVALIFFNRPDSLKQVFESVRCAKPSKLFLIQDGQRTDKDLDKILKCREIVENIDWKCDVFKNYSENNLGCGKRMSSGITWVFDYVEKAIILEDDCVPNSDFFIFCDENLERYKEDERILMITGMNHFNETKEVKEDYFFAINGAIWGWATWRRAWNYFDYSVKAIENDDIVDFLLNSGIEPLVAAKADVKQWKKTNQLVKNGEKMSYWAHQWRLCKLINHNLCIIPKVNLVSNVGDIDPTHPSTLKENCIYHHMNTSSLHYPLIHPEHVYHFMRYDDLYYKDFYPSFIQRIINRFKRLKANVN